MSVRIDIMNITLKTLPITEQMYDYVFQHWRLDYPDVWEKSFIQIESQEEWSALLDDDKDWIPTKHYIYVKGDSTFILSRRYIFGDCPTPDYGHLGTTYWYVWHFRASDSVKTTTKVDKVINGAIAWAKFYAQLKKHYTHQEIDDIIKEFGTSDEETKPILHRNIFQKKDYVSNKIYQFDKVYYYDLNKAYAANLMTFFPRLKDWMLEQYKKDKPYFKKVINYAVGMMQRFDSITDSKVDYHRFHLLRNTIVTNTTTKMDEAMSSISDMESEIVYVNTDGFMINNPSNELAHSLEIGDFGEETVDNHIVWMTRVNQFGYQKYSIMQWYENGEKVVKAIGGFQQEEKLTSKIDLKSNKTVLFNTTITKKKRVVTEIKEIENYGC